LRFLRDEKWSNARNLAFVIGVTYTAAYKTLRKLENRGFIRSCYIPELKMKIWGITQMGLLYSWNDTEDIQSRPVFEASKIKPVMMQHHLDLQVARFHAETEGWSNWVPGNLLPKGIQKRPDAVVQSSVDKKIVAIELERTIKTKKRYEAIFSIYLQAIKRGDYHSVHYLCPDQEFARRLRRMFSLINSIPIAGQRVKISNKHLARFSVYYLDNWPISDRSGDD